MKKYKKLFYLSFLLIFIPAIVGVVISGSLPDQVAVHFDFAGNADGFANKWFAIVGLPCFLAFVHGLCVTAVINDPKNENMNDTLLRCIIWLVPLISFVVEGSLLIHALGWKVDLVAIMEILLGAVFVCLGNYMGKNHQNASIGIRTPWTLYDREIWNRTHRLAGKLMVLAGIFSMIASCISGMSQIAFAGLILSAILPVFYSFYLYKKKK